MCTYIPKSDALDDGEERVAGVWWPRCLADRVHSNDHVASLENIAPGMGLDGPVALALYIEVGRYRVSVGSCLSRSGVCSRSLDLYEPIEERGHKVSTCRYTISEALEAVAELG